MGLGGSNIRQQSELSVARGAKTKSFRAGGWGWGVDAGTMATVSKKVTAGYHSSTGPEQCLSCGLVGQRCAVGETQDKRKHQREDNGARSLLQKMVFLQLQGGCTQNPPPGATRPAIIPHVLSALLAQRHLIPPHCTSGRLGFWPSMSKLLVSRSSCEINNLLRFLP